MERGAMFFQLARTSLLLLVLLVLSTAGSSAVPKSIVCLE